MQSWQIAAFLRPMVAVAFVGYVGALAAIIRRYMPEGRVKRLLFRRLWR
jgi:hypothetical protein